MMNFNTSNYLYTLASTGLGSKKVEVFMTRNDAMKRMYKLCHKYNLVINEIWDDNHDKTYKCNDGVSFYIQRDI